ncbi:MAG: PsiF family protein [Burkholderiaceae bacterium]|jgi:hypothetical protein|nr:PsiF family protein [Burkholderiaceae bacterium]
MKKFLPLIAALSVCLGFLGNAHAAAANSQQEKMRACNTEAGTKALKGDARKTFMKDCLSHAAPEAQSPQDRMRTCNADPKAKALKGDARKAFMKGCLSSH